ncbi:FG-GAP-like repeat-containing protein [Candidatus Binatia bacterium]|nr:FG-GAP-like repeat-containing protein [Candidatus Binatia bacterium]
MRKLLPAVLLWSVIISSGGSALAQITLVPGQAVQVPRRPTYITAADFNGDRLADAVALNPGSNKVTVLFGDAQGTFKTISDFDVARGLEQVQAGDLNNDGRPDIAIVTNFAGGSVYVLYSELNGTFKKAAQLGKTSGRRPVDLAIGDFDRPNGKGNDVATADINSDSVGVFLNFGGQLGFSSPSASQAGDRPQRVVAGDINRDGNDDLVTLNTGASGAESVSVLFSSGTGAFSSPRPFTVGVRTRTLVLADVNRDQALDVLVLNGGISPRTNNFDVSVLLNNNPAPGSTDPLFSTMMPVKVSCPSSIGGIAIFCQPNGIAAGDFDQDGFADFAVSVHTIAQTGSSPTAGLLLAYAGNGDGTFSFATQASVGTRPKGIVAADFNGDLIPDLAVAEEGDRTVRVVHSLPPVKRNLGLPCNLGTQCESTLCLDGVCCNASQCPAGQFCNIPGSEGTCAVPLGNGNACTAGNQCASDNCVGGFCCGSATCPAGQYCNTGSCGPPAPNGTHCATPDQCASSNCVDGVCCASEICPFGARCDIPGSEGVCIGPQPIGNACTSPSQCDSGFCVDGACCGVNSCPLGQSCNVPGSAGGCANIPPASATPTPTATPTSTPTPQPIGAQCSSGTQCVSGACVDGVCCASASCPQGQACNIFGALGSCSALRPDGQECRTDGDCLSGNCQPGTPPVCAAPRTPTPTLTATRTPTPTPLANGQFCLDDSDCQSDFCTDGFCCAARSCPEGQACNIEGREGQCSAPKPTGGQSCNPSEASPCAGGLFCNPESVCCQSATCPQGQRCDITGKEGRCAAPSGSNAECSKNTDCQSGLECRFDATTEKYRCLPPRTPTPTLIPQPTPTKVGGTTITSTRSGGCSIADTGSDSNGAWLLAALPVALGLRRRAIAIVSSRRQ